MRKRIGLLLAASMLLLVGCGSTADADFVGSSRVSSEPHEKDGQMEVDSDSEDFDSEEFDSEDLDSEGAGVKTSDSDQSASEEADAEMSDSEESDMGKSDLEEQDIENDDSQEIISGDDTIIWEDTKEDTQLAQRVDQKLSEMTLEEKVAQMFLVTPESLTGYSQVTQAGSATEQAMEQYPVGGLIYFSANLKSEQQVKDMTAGQQKYAMDRIGLPLFLAIDEEGGEVTRIASSGLFDVPSFENMSQIGASGDVHRAYEVGSTIGSYLHELGFNLDFAPVADVLTNDQNTVVKNRSFGSDPKLVSDMVCQELRGLQQQDIYGCVKHFPGHGATAADTHAGYAYTDKTWEQLQESELQPFAAAISQGVSFVMVGHISLPSVTGTDEPASCSRTIIQEKLRDTMGYDGIVVTDGLKMKAITDHYTSGQVAVKFVQAGGDLLLEPENFRAAYEALIHAVEDHTISEERIDESLRRILRVKLSMLQVE